MKQAMISRIASETIGTDDHWDERYRLVIVDAASSRIEYEYDVLNRKTARIEGSTTNYFVYDGNQIVADLDGDGTLLRTYIRGTGIDNLLAFTDHITTNTYYPVKDHQNTVMALVDATHCLRLWKVFYISEIFTVWFFSTSPCA